MAEFPHLKLPIKVEGVAKPIKGGGGNKPQEQTLQNRNDRVQHGQQLANSANALLNRWYSQVQENEHAGVDIPNKDDIPVFLEIDTNTFNVDSLRNWGIELISEEEGGFIIGASFDKLDLFQKNVGQFIEETGRYRNSAAQIWSFASDETWRLEHIVKGPLKENWGNISDNQTYDIELTVSCPLGQMKDYPNRGDFDSEGVFQQKIDEYHQQEQQLWQERDEKQRAREVEVEGYLAIYNCEVLDLWDNGVDAVAFKIAITGQGLKHIVFTYQYLYEAKFSSVFNVESNVNPQSVETELEIIAPHENSPKVCVIDSGIQEYHRLISPAIDAANSRSYLENDTSTADHVRQSGHGTKVAGLILYSRQIPISGQYQLEAFIQNARILDASGEISRRKFGPKLMETIVYDYSPTKIFNLSVCDDCSYNGSHMSPLSASIDKLMHEKDVLFVISAGNLYSAHANNLNPGISEHLHGGKTYPNYLDEDTSKIADPGTSSFAISVGSIAHSNFEDADYKSFATADFISPFSRTGLGMWKTIKPDVVEYGGDLLLNKQSADIITHDSISCEVLNSTLYGAPAVGKDAYGTSFSTPKVTSIVAKLAKEHPTESAQMYRALVIQSARLPSHCFNNPTLRDIRYYGYGLPDLNRALNNTPNRITFIQNGHVGAKKADIYTINIPEELRGEGRGFKFLIEVTLAFTSRIRQTRKGAHSYLGTWLEWRSSKYNEGFNSFRSRTIEYLDNENSEETNLEGEGAIKWCLRENPAWTGNGINRNNSTVQKSWVEVEPYQLAETFSLAIVGHIGWDKNLEHEAPYALCVSFEALDPDVNVYNLIAEAQIQIPVEVEEEVELRL